MRLTSSYGEGILGECQVFRQVYNSLNKKPYLVAGANLDVKDIDDGTALDRASADGHTEVVRLALARSFLKR